jgi:hypothetical protein
MPEGDTKRFMKNLGETINEALTDSPKVNECLEEIREAGYEIFLVIEAKVGFTRKENEEPCDPSDFFDESDGPVELQITPEDEKFLKSLKISVD